MKSQSPKHLLIAILSLSALAQAFGVGVSEWSHRKAVVYRNESAGVFGGDQTLWKGAIAIGGSASFVACVFLFPCLKRRKEKTKKNEPQSREVSSTRSVPVLATSPRESTVQKDPQSDVGTSTGMSTTPGALTFTMAEIIRVTGNFSQKLPRSTYKGKLRDGTPVEVKRAKKDALETRQSVEFRNEVQVLSNLDHLNLVKLYGYFEDERERILVMEYVPNGTLREHLDGVYNVVLEFSTRLDIAIDVAHALTYLHLYADQPIIHRDVKSSHILLTDTFRAKVSDFGFSREGPSDVGATHVSTQVKGTAGYLDPEYLQTYQLTPKSDVYSFGILLLEIFSGRRPIELARPSDERITVRWAFKKFIEGKIEETLDPALTWNPALSTVLERLSETAFQCAAPTKRDRPTMKEAAESLWNIRKEYQALSIIPRAGSLENSQHHHHQQQQQEQSRDNPLQKMHSPLNSPVRGSSSPFYSPLRSPRFGMKV